MSLNLIKTLLILNTWSEASRRAAKLALKQRGKIRPGGKRSADSISTVKSKYLEILAKSQGGSLRSHEMPARQGTLSGKAVSKGKSNITFKSKEAAEKFAEKFKKRAKSKKSDWGDYEVSVSH